MAPDAPVATTVGAFALLCLTTYFSLVYGDRLIAHIGQNGVNAITRIMGLILATIGTQMVIAGFDGLGLLPKTG